MEALTTTPMPSSPSVTIPFLNRGIGGRNWCRRSRSRIRIIISDKTPSKFMFNLVLFRCRPEIGVDHQSDKLLFPYSSSVLIRHSSSSTDLAAGKYNGRRCSRIFMAPASSSSSPFSREEGPDEKEGNNDDQVERALGMDGSIPAGSGEFLRRVSSRAYDMRRNLLQSIDSSSYEVLDQNPWREDSKPVFVLTQGNNQLCTMKTRQSRSEVERELGLLFTRRTKWDKKVDGKAKHTRPGTEFSMFVEDIREGVLVFEDETEASRYCELLQGGRQRCEGIAQLEVSSVFDICQKMRALAVLFRRGRTPPLPTSLEQNLRARKRSLEDQDLM